SSAIFRAMSEAPIRRANRQRKIGDSVLQSVLQEGPGYQDWLAEHADLKGTFRRARVYLQSAGLSELDRERRRRAAEREFRLLETLQHPGILSPLAFEQTEFGPALLFPHEPEMQPLGLYLAVKEKALSQMDRLELVRDVSEVIRYAHDHRVVHRALSPEAILVGEDRNGARTIRIMNWQLGFRLEAERETKHGAI